MCGILGAINTDFDASTLLTIAHRGPDDFGIESFSVGGHDIKLGQRRLSIIDLSPAGHQPMVSPCLGYAIIFNGEIYNHLDLRQKLPKDIVFKGHSDTETILHYLIHYGIPGIADFNGIFAIAFLDLKKCQLVLARDPFGVKPLYYSKEGNAMVFASEIRPINKLMGKGEVDKKALASLLRLRFNASPDTLQTTVKKVAPGHLILVDLNDLAFNTDQKYFAGALPTIQKNLAQPLNDYGVELEKAVKRQLLADVEVGVLLSGGIDSALVASLAQKHYSGNLKAFTIGFDGDFEEDEIVDAQETAQILGLEHFVKKITFSDFLGLIKECSRIVEEPLATTSMIPMYYLAELASRHVKVVLTGQGADEPLGGYTRYRSEVIREKIPAPLRGLVQPMAKVFAGKNEQLLRGANAVGIANELDRFLSVYEIFTKAQIKRLIKVDDTYSKQRVAYFHDILGCTAYAHGAERMMAIDTRMNLADDLLNYTDKITMNFSLECRVPMLDLELVKFIQSLPLDQKLDTKGGKIIHKEYAKAILPKNIVNRPKKGFQSPTNKWFRDEMDRVKELLMAPGTAFSGIFDQTEVAQLLKDHTKGFNKEKQIFLLLSLYYWLNGNI